ncbi:DNA-binding protein [Halobium salinum]|uniref:DNA-binding protein ACFO0N_15910 n=1 Tax=Halobium salinum TaxID=1364940 RepID=A0ABD5PF97_9EURY|nr:DNA-binding protein [Halobium salinum]
MSGNPDDDRLEKLREEKMQELQEQAEGQGNEEAQEQARQQQEAQKEALLRQYLTDDARQRLNAIQMSKPDFADQVERQLVALAQSGRIQEQIDEEQMKSLLQELKPESKSFDIRRR